MASEIGLNTEFLKTVSDDELNKLQRMLPVNGSDMQKIRAERKRRKLSRK